MIVQRTSQTNLQKKFLFKLESATDKKGGRMILVTGGSGQDKNY